MKTARLRYLAVFVGLFAASVSALGQIQVGSTSGYLTGYAADSGYGGRSYSETSTSPFGFLWFNLVFPGYEDSYAYSAGSTTWAVTSTAMQVSNQARQTVALYNPFGYQAVCYYQQGLSVSFQVLAPTYFTLTIAPTIQNNTYEVDGATLYDGDVYLGGWQGYTNYSSNFQLFPGHNYTMNYGSTYYLVAGYGAPRVQGFQGYYTFALGPHLGP